MSERNNSVYLGNLFGRSQTINNDLGIQIPSGSGSSQPSTSNSSPNSCFLSDSPSSLSPAQTELANWSPLFYNNEMSPSDHFLDSLVTGMIEGITFGDDVTSSGVEISESPSTSQQQISIETGNAYSLPMTPSPNMISNPSIFVPLSRPITSPPVFCNLHPNNVMIYCYSCSAIMCDICHMSKHRYHSTMELAKATELAKTHGDQILELIKGYLAVMESNEQTLSKFSKDINYAIYNVKAKYFSNFQHLFSDALERREELYWRLQEITTIKQTRIQSQQDVLNYAIDQLRNMAWRINNAKNCLNISGNPKRLIIDIQKASHEISKMKNDGLIHVQIEDHWSSFSRTLDEILESIDRYSPVRMGPMELMDEARALRGRGDLVFTIQPPQQQCRQHQHKKLQLKLRRSDEHHPQLQPYYGQQQQQNHFQVTLQYYDGSLEPVGNVARPLVVVKTLRRSPPPLPFLTIGDEPLKENFCRPWGVACDKEGNIIVADRSNNEIKIYNKNGLFVRSFGTHGSGPGQFDRPAGIVVDKYNRVIVADKDNHRIQIVSKYGDYILEFGERGVRNGQFNYPWDVSANSRCEIVVSDTRNHRIQLFSAQGEFLRKFGFETNPFMWKLLDSPRSVSFTPNGDILVSDFNNHHILVIDYQLQEAKVLGPERRKHPFLRIQGIKVDDVGNVIVADSRNYRIQVLDSTGKLKHFFGREGSGRGEMDRPAGIAISPEGQIVVVDFGNSRVLVF